MDNLKITVFQGYLFWENIDRNLQQIKFVNAEDKVVGAFHWVATHAVSMNNTNHLISADNLGYASYLLEQEYNPDDLVGKGPFVGAFSTSNSGDISPNILGPRCIKSGVPCNDLTSRCADEDDICIGKGPGQTDVENTQIIGANIFKAAMEGLSNQPQRELTGTVGFIHQFIEMAKQSGKFFNRSTQRYESFRGCRAAMGFSFGAGTTDGQGAPFFEQGELDGNEFWKQVRDTLNVPTDDDIQCQSPKPILLNTGGMSTPYLWQPQSVPTQILRIGDAIILGVPSEMTTMAGRRLRSIILDLGRLFGLDLVVSLTGMANTYASYVVTWEEYQVQRYEAASTPYGPHTLTIYEQQYAKLFTSLANGQTVEPGPTPLDETDEQLNFMLPLLMDSGPFGSVLNQPQETYGKGEEVTVTFVSGNPRNDLMTEESFFYVELQQSNGDWKVVATDASWESHFVWTQTNQLLGRSEIDFFWKIPSNASSGVYRVRHVGASRALIGGVRRYQGNSRTFVVL